jgi:hypothetical protein
MLFLDFERIGCFISGPACKESPEEYTKIKIIYLIIWWKGI